MKKASSIVITAIIIGILLPMSFNFGLDLVAHSTVIDMEWQLTVTGLVDNPLNLTIADLMAMPQTTIDAQIICVGPPRAIVEEGDWTGVELGLLLDKAGISPGAVKVAFGATDGFSTDLTIVDAENETVIIAYEKDGAPLSEKLRLVVPGKWGYKWIYLLNRIALVNYDFLGKYESEGYSDSAETTGGGAPAYLVIPKNASITISPNSPQSSSPSQSPSPSPTQKPSPTPNPQPEGGLTRTPTRLGLTEEITYILTTVAAVSIVSVGLIVYFVKFKKRK
jgi:hypothetical protein